MTETEIERLVVRLTGDGSSFQKMLQQAAQQSQNVVSSIGNATTKIQNFQHSIEGFAKGALGAFAGFGVVGTLKGAFDAFSGMEEKSIRLSAAIQVNGKDVAATTEEYNRFAKSIADVTTVTAGEVKGVLQLAEARGKSTEQAEEAARISVALAGQMGGEAKSFASAALALQDGNIHLAKHALGLRAVKDDNVALAQIQKMINTGWETQQKLADTSAGKIEKLSRSLKEITISMGGLIAEGIKPFIQAVSTAVDWVKKLDPGTKQIIVWTALALAALPLVSSAFGFLASTLSLLLSPIGALVRIIPALFGAFNSFLNLIHPIKLFFGFISLIGTTLGILGTTLGFLLSPLGLFLIAVTAIVAATVYFSGGLKNMSNWFGDIGQKIVNAVSSFGWLGDVIGRVGEDFSRAFNVIKDSWEGIKNAFAAGNIGLAFKIAWTGVQLAFAEGTLGMRKEWEVFSTWFAINWEETKTTALKQIGEILKATHGAIQEGRVLSLAITQEQANAEIVNFNAYVDKLNHDNEIMLKSRTAYAIQAGKEAIINMDSGVRVLKKELEELNGQAAEQARKAAGKAKEKLGDIKLPPVAMKIHANVEKISFAAFGSAEAQGRIANFQEAVKAQITPAPANSPSTTPSTGPATATGENLATSLLSKIKDGIEALVSKGPAAVIQPAGFASGGGSF